jgi:hypothetical protein
MYLGTIFGLNVPRYYIWQFCIRKKPKPRKDFSAYIHLYLSIEHVGTYLKGTASRYLPTWVMVQCMLSVLFERVLLYTAQSFKLVW